MKTTAIDLETIGAIDNDSIAHNCYVSEKGIQAVPKKINILQDNQNLPFENLGEFYCTIYMAGVTYYIFDNAVVNENLDRVEAVYYTTDDMGVTSEDVNIPADFFAGIKTISYMTLTNSELDIFAAQQQNKKLSFNVYLNTLGVLNNIIFFVQKNFGDIADNDKLVFCKSPIFLNEEEQHLPATSALGVHYFRSSFLNTKDTKRLNSYHAALTDVTPQIFQPTLPTLPAADTTNSEGGKEWILDTLQEYWILYDKQTLLPSIIFNTYRTPIIQDLGNGVWAKCFAFLYTDDFENQPVDPINTGLTSIWRTDVTILNRNNTPHNKTVFFNYWNDGKLLLPAGASSQNAFRVGSSSVPVNVMKSDGTTQQIGLESFPTSVSGGSTIALNGCSKYDLGILNNYFHSFTIKEKYEYAGGPPISLYDYNGIPYGSVEGSFLCLNFTEWNTAKVTNSAGTNTVGTCVYSNNFNWFNLTWQSTINDIIDYEQNVISAYQTPATDTATYYPAARFTSFYFDGFTYDNLFLNDNSKLQIQSGFMFALRSRLFLLDTLIKKIMTNEVTFDDSSIVNTGFVGGQIELQGVHNIKHMSLANISNIEDWLNLFNVPQDIINYEQDYENQVTYTNVGTTFVESIHYPYFVPSNISDKIIGLWGNDRDIFTISEKSIENFNISDTATNPISFVRVHAVYDFLISWSGVNDRLDLLYKNQNSVFLNGEQRLLNWFDANSKIYPDTTYKRENFQVVKCNKINDNDFTETFFVLLNANGQQFVVDFEKPINSITNSNDGVESFYNGKDLIAVTYDFENLDFYSVSWNYRIEDNSLLKQLTINLAAYSPNEAERMRVFKVYKNNRLIDERLDDKLETHFYKLGRNWSDRIKLELQGYLKQVTIYDTRIKEATL